MLSLLLPFGLRMYSTYVYLPYCVRDPHGCSLAAAANGDGRGSAGSMGFGLVQTSAPK